MPEMQIKGHYTESPLRTRCARIADGAASGSSFIFTLHRIYCHRCHERSIEQVPFISHPKARLSNEFERTILELREQISIRALANYFHLRWHTVKEIEKRYLQHKFATIDTSKVQAVGVDEIHIGHGQANRAFLTIVRDLESGAVIHVGNGKGVSALEGALCKLTASRLQLVTMDMTNAYSTWFAEHFPQAQIVFDHFHVIKLMNDKLDHVRRRVTAPLDSMECKHLKGLRFVSLKNEEDIPEGSFCAHMYVKASSPTTTSARSKQQSAIKRFAFQSGSWYI